MTAHGVTRAPKGPFSSYSHNLWTTCTAEQSDSRSPHSVKGDLYWSYTYFLIKHKRYNKTEFKKTMTIVYRKYRTHQLLSFSYRVLSVGWVVINVSFSTRMNKQLHLKSHTSIRQQCTSLYAGISKSSLFFSETKTII